jgi:hypothetical protein
VLEEIEIYKIIMIFLLLLRISMKRTKMKDWTILLRDLDETYFHGIIKKDQEVRVLNCNQFMNLKKRIMFLITTR